MDHKKGFVYIAASSRGEVTIRKNDTEQEQERQSPTK